MTESHKTWKRGGPKRDITERFWEKVDRSGGQDTCWNWQAAKIGNGYGTFAETPYVRTLAHRMAWRLTHSDPIPDGMDLCHRCDNRRCCNPAHLFIGTRADNLRDCREKGRNACGARHGNAKLTDDDVRWIREWCAAGWSQRALASVFNLDPSTISNIWTGKHWRQPA